MLYRKGSHDSLTVTGKPSRRDTRRARAASLLCVHCGGGADPGRMSCSGCREAHRVKYRARKEKKASCE